MRKSFRQTVWLRLPATTTRTCTDKQRTFFVPTLGICIWNWICLHCTRTLRRGSEAAVSQGLRVRIPPGCTNVCLLWVLCVVCRDVRFGLITLPEESYWVWCVWVWSCSLGNKETLAHILRSISVLNGKVRSKFWPSILKDFVIP